MVNKTKTGVTKPKKPLKEVFDYASMSSVTSFARSRDGGHSERGGKPAGELNNINKGVSPSSGRNGCISVHDAIDLTQMAYYNAAIFRSTIDMQTDFSNSKLHFKGAKGVSLKFFQKWYEKINGWALAQQWFREWFRSGNVFTYRFDAKMDTNEFRRITRSASQLAKAGKTFPIKYIVFNPCDMKCLGTISFTSCPYGKVLNNYEVSRLKNPQTEEDRQFLRSLSPEARKQINQGMNPVIELKPERLSAVFNGKQDYEAMAVPPYYGVLTDLNLKMELRAGDAVIARAIDYATLLITCGDEKRSGKDIQSQTAALESLFRAQSTGRIIFSDYTTKGQFIIPDLKTIFGVAKYEAISEDIANGLCNIFYSNDKFANAQLKIKIFAERLSQAREAYLQMFLLPEMRKIAEEWGFQSIPDVQFEDVNLNDQVEQMKIFSRLFENGAITQEELLDSFDTFQLPTPGDSVESQREFKKMRDEGLYEPILGGSKKEEEGRPEGSKAPKRVNVGPIGGSVVTNMDKIKETVKALDELKVSVESAYKGQTGCKRVSGKHKEICDHVIEAIVINESAEKWDTSIADYLKNPYGQPANKIKEEILAMRDDLQIPLDSAVLLFHSKE